MTSRTITAVVHLAVFISVFCVINAIPTETTPTQDPLNITTANNSENTNFSPVSDVSNATFANFTTMSVNTTELSLNSTVTPTATTESTINVSGPSTRSDVATSASLPTTTLSLTGSSDSTNNTTQLKTTSTQTNAITSILTTQKDPTHQTYTTKTTTDATATTMLSDTDKHSLNYSEIILTSVFSTILVIVVLVILAYSFKKCLRQSSQYSHHPLRETTYDPADQYLPPDDTLVISGGLYDAPRIYNPNMTVLEEEETHNDLASFSSRPGQFRLEFLPGDRDLDPSFNRTLRRHV